MTPGGPDNDPLQIDDFGASANVICAGSGTDKMMLISAASNAVTGGLMLGFGTAGHGIDLAGVSSLAASRVHFA